MATFIQPLSAKHALANAQNAEFNTLTYDNIILGNSKFPGSNNDGAIYVFDRVPSTSYYTQVKGISATLGSGIYFGNSNAVNSNYIYVGAPGYNGGNGAVYEYFNSGGSRFGLNRTILGTNRSTRGLLGVSMKLFNSTNLFIGAMYAQTKAPGDYYGAIYHYTDIAGTWSLTSVLSGTNNIVAVGEEFGLDFDGTTTEIIAGAPNYLSEQGRAYVMKYDASTPTRWANTQVITLNGGGGLNGPYVGQAGDLFGLRVAVKNDIALIAAPRFKSSIAGFSTPTGAVFLYSRSGINWTYTSIITAEEISDRSSEFGTAIAINDNNNTVLIGADNFNGEGRVFCFDISNPFIPRQIYSIERPVALQDAKFGHDIDLLTTQEDGIALFGSYGQVVNSSQITPRFPSNAGAAFLYNAINITSPTPTPSPTPPQVTPTPQPTPVLKPLNWYGINSLDPISVGDGGGTPGSNYPKTPALGGPGRNYSILREIGALYVDNPGIYSFSTFRGSLYQLAISYSSWCLNNGLNAANPTAMSEFNRSRGISLGFSYTLEKKPVTRSKYCDSNNGGVRITIPYYSAVNRYGNPIRTTTYTITIGANTSVATSKTIEGLGTGNQAWSIVDNSTGYTRSGTVGVGCGTNAYVTVDSQDYKQQFPANPPV